MAIYDLTAKATVGVGADVMAHDRDDIHANKLVVLEAYLDMAKLVADGYVLSTGDVFQLLEVPAGYLVLDAGAEVMTAFDGTAAVDVDWGAGDDIIDGADVTSTGYCAAGSNGQTRTIRGTAASTYTEFVAAADTVDVTLTSANATTGVLRVYVAAIDLSARAKFVAKDVTRDQLA